jgi:hypothetical protein
MFFKKGRGALWVCIWNQGGGGPKKFGTTGVERPDCLWGPSSCSVGTGAAFARGKAAGS